MMTSKPVGKKLPGAHSCGDCALKCIDCKEQICPRCFVQCAVGNRCKKCAGRFTSHVLLVSNKVLAKVVAVTALIGFAFGYVQPFLTNLVYGFYGYLLQFGLFFLVGKVVQKVAGYKLGPRIATAVLVGLLIGLVAGPMRTMALAAFNLYQGGPDTDPQTIEVGQDLLGSLGISTLIMMSGVLLPFLRK